MKRALILAMAIIMSAAVFSGCGNKDNDREDTKKESTKDKESKKNKKDKDKEKDKDEDKDADEESLEEEVEEEEEISADEMKDIYLDFMDGKVNMVVKEADLEWLEEGKEYSFDEMTDAYQNYFADMFEEAVLSDTSYAFIDCGADGVPEFAIRQIIGLEVDQATMFSIFKYMDDQLYLISSQYGYYRTYVSVNEYGYISAGGSGGAALYSEAESYINADGEEVFLYCVTTEMGLADAYISYYDFPGHEAPEGYPADTYSYDEKSVTTITYNFTEYTYGVDDDDSEYYENNIYTFCDEDGNYCAPSGKIEKIYKENGIKFYDMAEVEQMVLEHEKSLGVTDEIRDGKEVDWISY